jgi:hypothetical protein
MPAETLAPPQNLNPTEAVGGEQVAAEVSINPQNIEDIARQFSPRVEVDDQGLTRNVFEYQGKTFSFLGREETPDYPTIESSRPEYLGHESVWLMHPSTQEAPSLPDEETETYRNAVWTDEQIKAKEAEDISAWQTQHNKLMGFKEHIQQLHEANDANPEHFLVEQSPLGIYTLMERLQPDNPRWKQEREAVATNQYDESTLLLIDTVTAVNALAVDERGNDNENHPPLGEAVVVAALLGDERAQALTLTAAKLQEQAETASRETALHSSQEWATGEMARNAEAFKPEELVVVHATSYEPEASSDGYQVQTTHDANGYPRSTIHTAINHKVASHLFGSWDNKDYVLIAGLDRMLAIDGSPNSSNGADTWWTRNPGETLDFPGGTLIAPGASQPELVVRDGSRISYKSEGITSGDLNTLDPYTQKQIEDTLNEDGKTIELASETGQRIVANIVRDSLVRQEITETRSKKWLDQSDDKFMPVETGNRLEKMYVELGLSIPAGLHNGGSQELWVEQNVAQGKRTLFGGNYDPKIRRVAYASGMMNGGGEDRQRYIQRKDGEGFG